MNKIEKEISNGLQVLPAFPLVLVTVAQNIMPAAGFHFYSFAPQPSVMVGIMPEHQTCSLINSYREFGINLPTKEQIEIVRVCGSTSGKNEDKYRLSGVTPFKGKHIASYLIAECPVNLECSVVYEIPYPGSHRWFIGQVQAVHVAPEYSRDQALTYWSKEFRSMGEVLALR